MMNNTIVNATVNTNTTTMEEKNMMNISIEALKGMKRDELRRLAKEYGIKGYSKMTKNELVSAFSLCRSLYCKASTSGYTVNPLDDPEVQALDVSDEALMTLTIETKKEVVTMNNDLMKAIAKEIMAQTLTKDKNGKWVLQKYALFYKATKTDVSDYMVVGKRLWGVISKVIGVVEGEDKKTSDRIKEVLEQMESLGMITKVATERTYITLTPSTMSQDEKDQLNGLWRTKDIVTEKTKDEKVKVTAVTVNGKEVLNQLYPSWIYRATSAQMRNLYYLSK